MHDNNQKKKLNSNCIFIKTNQTMNDIEERKDVFQLVSTFYGEIRKDERLGPIFNGALTTDEIWDEHMEKLTDFWESNLFGVIKFEGNPMAAHKKVDKSNHYAITQDDFHQWLMIWNTTVDSLFTGVRANLAKEKARRMATHLFVNVWKNKPVNLTE